ncbi:MAG: DUF1592 domain-containing protein, partial [Myxococcota bacterium]
MDPWLRVALLLVALCVGCEGTISNEAPRPPNAPGLRGSGGRGGEDGPPSDLVRQVTEPRATCAPGGSGGANTDMRRLSRAELEALFSDALGAAFERDEVQAAFSAIPSDPLEEKPIFFEPEPGLALAETLLAFAETAAQNLVQGGAGAVGECAANASETCAASVLSELSLSLLRRPLEHGRRAMLLQTFRSAGGTQGLQRMLSQLLLAPEIVFHLDRMRGSAEGCLDLEAARTDAVLIQGEAEAPVPAELREDGWVVWELDADAALTNYEVFFEVQGAPVRVLTHVNGSESFQSAVFAPGLHSLRRPIDIGRGEQLRLGVRPEVGEGTIRLHRVAVRRTRCATESVLPVDAFTIASRLSFGLPGRGPDAALLAAAADGSLLDQAVALEHGQRLSQSSAGRAYFREFARDWLSYSKLADPNGFVGERAGIETDGLAAEAVEEALRFIDHVVFELDGDPAQLLTEPVGFPHTERLAALYESDISTGEPVELPHHAGLLLRLASLMSPGTYSSPVVRGVSVRERMLCNVFGGLPEVPDARFDNAPDRRETSNRDYFDALTGDAACAACHAAINPPGFSLEAFGPLGNRREREEVLDDETGELIATHPVDASAWFDADLDAWVPVEEPNDLVGEIAASQSLRECVAQRVYSWSRLRAVAPRDSCALTEIVDALNDGASVREAWVRSVVNADLTQRVHGGEL